MSNELITLTKAQARSLIGVILTQAENLRDSLTTLRDRGGWQVLEYESWAKCCEVELGYTKRHANRLIKAEEVKAKVGPIGPTPLPEAQARELSKAPPELQATVWEQAKEATDGKPTAAAIREVVDATCEDACVNCGGTEFDDEGDCVKCYEPTAPPTLERIARAILEEEMAEANSALERIARAITALHKDATELGNPHLNDRLNTLLGQLKSAAGTVRVSKGFGTCKYCGGKKCKSCKGTGWQTKNAWESAPDKGGK